MRNAIPLALCLTLLGGCFGSFRLTTKVWEFNKDISSNLVVQEIVFLAFMIIPVYGVATFVDAIVLNTIEAFTGDNPLSMAPGESRTVALADGSSVTVIAQDDGSVAIELDRQGKRLARKLRRQGDRLQLTDGDAIVAELTIGDDGTAMLVDAEGTPTLLDRETLARAAAAQSTGGTVALAHEVARVVAN